MHTFFKGLINCQLGAVLALLLLLSPPWPALAGQFENELLTLINEYRTANHLQPLTMRSAYVALARDHSRKMRAAGRMSHEGLLDHFHVAKTFGARGCVENIGRDYPTAEGEFDGWQRSPPHDRNLLNPKITVVGIAKVGQYITFLACY